MPAVAGCASPDRHIDLPARVGWCSDRSGRSGRCSHGPAEPTAIPFTDKLSQVWAQLWAFR